MNLDIFLFNLTSIYSYFTPVQFDLLPTNLSFADDAVAALFALSRTFSESLFIPIKFTELQTILLTIFLVIISINLALIGFYWSKYGGVITDRFIRQSTLKEIEELKLSVAKLKLPNEHTPRI